ncbi:GtrA family protein [Bacillus mesophilus]|uniref:GtrA family protein n=2 Tax=Bacillus mesophilus TaxID=1808955 RepID=A0A6M0Q3T2_9BACI|nr:GtrA family protein [Bacillus mesophilus]NEY70864.1 GtrA family protein [Bacillus mesophilus]
MILGPLTFLSYLKRTSPFIRFLLVGVINTLVGLSIIFILLELTLNYWFATFVGNSVGAAVSFFLNRMFTFKSSVSIQRGIPTFTLTILVCYFGSYATGKWLVMLAGPPSLLPIFISEQDLAVLLGAALYTLSNYLGQKYFVFSKRTVSV